MTQSHFRFVIAMLARSARVPIGFEEVADVAQPFDGNLAKVPVDERVTLVGLTVGRALDLLVAADPRYAWREQNRVVLLRPVSAWRDGRHFLSTPVDTVHVRNRKAIEVVKELYERQGVRASWSAGGTVGDPSHFEHDLDRPISLSLEASTFLDVLNATIKAHGGLGWLIEYVHGPAELKNGCIRVITFDGKFGGVGRTGCQNY